MLQSESMLDAVESLREVAAELGDGASEDLACELAEQIPRDEVNLIVAGQFKRGKSSIVNAFLGADLMPTGALPVTGVTTAIRFDERRCVKLRMRRGGEMREVDPSDLHLYVSEQFNPGNGLGVDRVDVYWPSERLRGVALFDTPGVGSVHRHNTAAAFAALPRADAALLVVGPEPPIGREELEFAREVVASSEVLFVALNKSDLAGGSLTEVVDFTRDALSRSLEREVDVVPVSALRVRAAQDAGAEDAEFARLEAAVRNFVDQGGHAARSASLRRRATRIAERLATLAALRLATLRMPHEERQRRRGALQEALQVVDGRARPIELTLDDDVSGILLRLEDRLDRLHDRDGHAFRAGAENLAVLRKRSERESSFEKALDDVVSAWREDILAQANDELRTCAERYARMTGEIVRSVWAAGLDAADLDAGALAENDIQFAPANLKLVASLVPTTGLELLVGFVVDVLPNALRRPVLTKRYERLLERELDAARGKLRYGVARDLDVWRRSTRQTISSAIRHARSVVLAAFEGADTQPDRRENEAADRMTDVRNRLDVVRASLIGPGEAVARPIET